MKFQFESLSNLSDIPIWVTFLFEWHGATIRIGREIQCLPYEGFFSIFLRESRFNILAIIRKLKRYFGKNNFTTHLNFRCTQGSLLQSCNVFWYHHTAPHRTSLEDYFFYQSRITNHSQKGHTTLTPHQGNPHLPWKALIRRASICIYYDTDSQIHYRLSVKKISLDI